MNVQEAIHVNMQETKDGECSEEASRADASKVDGRKIHSSGGDRSAIDHLENPTVDQDRQDVAEEVEIARGNDIGAENMSPANATEASREETRDSTAHRPRWADVDESDEEWLGHDDHRIGIDSVEREEPSDGVDREWMEVHSERGADVGVYRANNLLFSSSAGAVGLSRGLFNSVYKRGVVVGALLKSRESMAIVPGNQRRRTTGRLCNGARANSFQCALEVRCGGDRSIGSRVAGGAQELIPPIHDTHMYSTHTLGGCTVGYLRTTPGPIGAQVRDTKVKRTLAPLAPRTPYHPAW